MCSQPSDAGYKPALRKERQSNVRHSRESGNPSSPRALDSGFRRSDDPQASNTMLRDQEVGDKPPRYGRNDGLKSVIPAKARPRAEGRNPSSPRALDSGFRRSDDPQASNTMLRDQRAGDKPPRYGRKDSQESVIPARTGIHHNGRKHSLESVIPAKAGIHLLRAPWTPAFAGVTIRRPSSQGSGTNGRGTSPRATGGKTV